MSDLAHWIRRNAPAGATTHYTGVPAPGQIVALKCQGQWRACRVIEVGTRSGEPAVRVRPMRLDQHPDPVKAASEDRHYRWPDRCIWHELPEHYPVCRICDELMPCRHVVAEHHGKVALDRMARYETPGVCPSCRQPVTVRQASRTFEPNLHVPGGPPVTFHLRKACATGQDGALAYEQKIRKLPTHTTHQETRP